eukprot:5513707-Alexandrium_andersonii.AAC.1
MRWTHLGRGLSRGTPLRPQARLAEAALGDAEVPDVLVLGLAAQLLGQLLGEPEARPRVDGALLDVEEGRRPQRAHGRRLLVLDVDPHLEACPADRPNIRIDPLVITEIAALLPRHLTPACLDTLRGKLHGRLIPILAAPGQPS